MAPLQVPLYHSLSTSSTKVTTSPAVKASSPGPSGIVWIKSTIQHSYIVVKQGLRYFIVILDRSCHSIWMFFISKPKPYSIRARMSLRGSLPGLKSYMACTIIPEVALCRVTRGRYQTEGSLRSGVIEQKNKDLLWGLWWRRVKRRYDLHVRLLGFASGTSDLTLKCVEVSLLQQQQYLIFL